MSEGLPDGWEWTIESRGYEHILRENGVDLACVNEYPSWKPQAETLEIRECDTRDEAKQRALAAVLALRGETRLPEDVRKVLAAAATCFAEIRAVLARTDEQNGAAAYRSLHNHLKALLAKYVEAAE